MAAMWRLGRAAAASAIVALLVACGGGGGGGGGGTPPDPVPPAAAAPTRAEAARFLGQATFGATAADIDRVTQIGYRRWLDEQMALPQTMHSPEVPKFDDPLTPLFVGYFPIQSSFWRQAATAPDQLRQRLVFALSEIFVVSVHDTNVLQHPRGVAAYLDMLGTNSLGNWRGLIEGVALHPMMGLYLSHLGNRKEDPASGRIPDENFAREVMQLFAIGVDELNPDGTARRDGAGRTIDTYGNDDVMGLAKVFTGWSWHAPQASDDYFFAISTNPLRFADAADPERDIRPMRSYPQHHSTSEKRFLGTVIPAGTGADASVRIALDRLFAHPNAAPFFCRQLIQRLVTSNPSPAYVQHVAAVFADNGQGVRGDLRAVVRAVLLDAEARGAPTPADVTGGKLREPILRITAWMRAFDVQARARRAGPTTSPATRSLSIGQSPLQSPSVFNFFRPGYVPPQSEAGRAGLVVPEMQIASETTVASYLNVAEIDDRLLRHRLPARPLHRLRRGDRARRRSGGARRPRRPPALRRRDERRDEVARAPGGRVGAGRHPLSREPGATRGAVRDGRTRVHRSTLRARPCTDPCHAVRCSPRRPALGLGVATPFALNLAAVGAASAQTAGDYKAIVCVFLFGGNDCANTVIPYDAAAHAAYRTARPPIARDRATLVPLPTQAGEPALALPPELASFAAHYRAGRATIVANVGPLVAAGDARADRRRLGGVAGQALLAQRPAVDLAGGRHRRHAVRLGRADRRRHRRRQRPPDLHRHVDHRQRGVAVRPFGRAIPGHARGRDGDRADFARDALRIGGGAVPCSTS